MSDTSSRLQPAEPRQATDDAVPLAEMPWSDNIVGIGFFADELGLGESWSWSARGLTR
jgi:hypothetical protein